MGIIMQAVYRRQADPTISVPAPMDGNGDPHWYDHLASQQYAWARSGVTHMQLPPVSMSSAANYPNADGYGVFWEYDLGNDDRPTRFGTAERLQRLCAIAHANGIAPLADWVPHQRSGGKNIRYNYRSATGEAGRFPKGPGCFRELYPGEGKLSGRVPQDPVASPWDDWMFGDELCPVNSVPKGYVQNGLNDAGDWLYRRLDLAGCRNDCTKGQAFSAVYKWGTYGAMNGKTMIGEYAEGNRDTLAWWVRTLGYKFGTYDFEVKYRVRDFCNAGSRYDMRRLQWSGLASLGRPYSYHAVTFLENADSDTNGFGSVVFNKLLGYAWILTAEGWPSIYYRDYAEEKYCYGLKTRLDNLFWIHEHLANGETAWRHSEYQFVVYERLGIRDQGKPGVLVGLNNDVWDPYWKRANVQTNFGPYALLHDYSGHGQDVWTDGNGRVTIWIPPNVHGRGYVCYAWAGLSQPNRTISRSTTQVFEGASDLDIPPALAGKTIDVTRIYVAKDAEVSLANAVPAGVTSPQLIVTTPSKDRLSGTIMRFKAADDGWYQIRMASPVGAATSLTPFKLTAKYKAPLKLAKENY